MSRRKLESPRPGPPLLSRSHSRCWSRMRPELAATVPAQATSAHAVSRCTPSGQSSEPHIPARARSPAGRRSASAADAHVQREAIRYARHHDQGDPKALLLPSPKLGNAINTEPAIPVSSPEGSAPDGTFLASAAATMVTNIGVVAFNIPGQGRESRRSAKGNMLSGNANQRMLNAKMPGHADRSMGFRAAGKKDSVAKPIAMRMNETPFGPIASNPSAMKRNDAPRMIPGVATRSQSAVDACFGFAAWFATAGATWLFGMRFGCASRD